MKKTPNIANISVELSCPDCDTILKSTVCPNCGCEINTDEIMIDIQPSEILEEE